VAAVAERLARHRRIIDEPVLDQRAKNPSFRKFSTSRSP
jgi:hypothetical protein